MIAIASDHGGFALRQELAAHLKERGEAVLDLGCADAASCDYADYAQKACEAVLAGQARCAILICGTGIGMSMAANRLHGIRAALCSDCFSAEFTRRHNDANVLCLGARVVGAGLALKIADTFLSFDFEGGRHRTRIDKIEKMGSLHTE